MDLWSVLKMELILVFMVSFEGEADFGIYGLAGVEGCLDLWFDLRSYLRLAAFS